MVSFPWWGIRGVQSVNPGAGMIGDSHDQGEGKGTERGRCAPDRLNLLGLEIRLKEEWFGSNKGRIFPGKDTASQWEGEWRGRNAKHHPDSRPCLRYLPRDCATG